MPWLRQICSVIGAMPSRLASCSVVSKTISMSNLRVWWSWHERAGAGEGQVGMSRCGCLLAFVGWAADGVTKKLTLGVLSLNVNFLQKSDNLCG